MAGTSSALAAPPADQSEGEIGGFVLDEIFRGKEPLSKDEQELAVEFLRRSEQIQLERLQCLADGALLGAEQVQDVRLELLEQGPEVNTTMVIMDLFVGLLLDSSIAGRLMKRFAETTVKRLVIRDRSLYVASMRDVRETMKNTAKLRSEAHLQQILRSDLRAKEYLESAKRWRRVGEWASNSDASKDVTAVAKAARNTGKARLGPKPLSIEGDTPGVSLLGSVHEFVSAARLRVRFQYQRMETFIRLGIMSGGEARAFLMLAEFDPVDSPLKEIRDRCKLLFEAIIWAGIFGFDSSARKLRAGATANRGSLEGVDDRLARYWIKRFGNEVERWVGEMSDQARRSRGLHPLDWNDAPYVGKLGYIENYFRSILADLPQRLDEAQALASSVR